MNGKGMIMSKEVEELGIRKIDLLYNGVYIRFVFVLNRSKNNVQYDWSLPNNFYELTIENDLFFVELT